MPNRSFRTPALLGLLLAASTLLAGCRPRLGGGAATAPLPTDALPLAQARAQHPTRLLRTGPSPQSYDAEVPPGVRRVTFGRRKLFAWVAQPAAAGRRPALLFAHGGWSLGASDFEDVRPFVDAGFVVMAPAWRGENGNPGAFEMQYGEVDDAADALNYLAKLPNVDAKRLYAAGHSSGGTLALLLAETSPRLRAAAACGAFPDMRAAIAEQGSPVFDETPFDWQDPIESDLRSPGRHVKDLHCPVALFYGADEDYYIAQARQMEARGKALGKPVTVEVFPGTDHWTALRPAVQRMLALFSR